MTHAPELHAVERTVIAYQRSAGSFIDALREVVDYQRRHIGPLAKFWSQRGFTAPPDRAEDVPPVPTDVYRSVRLSTSEARARRVFRTSGTTSGARGEAWRVSTRAYDEGAALAFKERVLPDYDRIAFQALVFDPATAPDSSLSHMVSDLHARYGVGDIDYALTPDAVHVEPLIQRLRDASTPQLVFGTAFGLVHLLDSLDAPVALPPGSRVVETGGFKGRSREIPRDEFYRLLCEQLGVPSDRVYSEYSMTELSSQLYSGWTAAPPTPHLLHPAWCRVVIRDPITLEPRSNGERGLVSFVDLANVDVPCAVLTSDLGTMHATGLELFGRAPGATPRGCSLAVEELLELTRASR